MSSPHSLLAPSASSRWKQCTKSVSYIEENDAILPPSGGKEADEGTRAHALLTAILKHTLGQVPDNPEMAALIDDLVKFIHSRMGSEDRLLVDQRVPLFYSPKDTGTLDVALVNPKRILILDLKYGVGVSVQAKENTQLAIYAESEIRALEQIETVALDTPVELIIWQPRDRWNSTALRQWDLTRGGLANFCAEIDRKAKQILAGKALEFVAGPHCDKSFCRARGICSAYAMQGLSAISEEPVDVVLAKPLQLTPPDKLTRQERQKVIKAKPILVEWLEQVENQEVAELMAGRDAMSFKLVTGKANRAWHDPNLAVSLLTRYLDRSKVLPLKTPEIVSPAQAEKLLTGVDLKEEDQKELANLIIKPEGKPTLVPIEDKREAIQYNRLAGLVKDFRSLI